MCMLQGREGKVIQVYRRKWVIHVERITREKVNGEYWCSGVIMGKPGVSCLAELRIRVHAAGQRAPSFGLLRRWRLPQQLAARGQRRMRSCAVAQRNS